MHLSDTQSCILTVWSQPWPRWTREGSTHWRDHMRRCVRWTSPRWPTSSPAGRSEPPGQLGSAPERWNAETPPPCLSPQSPPLWPDSPEGAEDGSLKMQITRQSTYAFPAPPAKPGSSNGQIWFYLFKTVLVPYTKMYHCSTRSHHILPLFSFRSTYPLLSLVFLFLGVCFTTCSVWVAVNNWLLVNHLL